MELQTSSTHKYAYLISNMYLRLNLAPNEFLTLPLAQNSSTLPISPTSVSDSTTSNELEAHHGLLLFLHPHMSSLSKLTSRHILNPLFSHPPLKLLSLQRLLQYPSPLFSLLRLFPYGVLYVMGKKFSLYRWS